MSLYALFIRVYRDLRLTQQFRIHYEQIIMLNIIKYI